jgi:S1-C subfamily serine protease
MNQIRKMMKNKMNVNRVQMNRVTSIIMGTAVALVLFLATGCASVKDHDAVYTPIDYTAEDAVASEIERITQLPEDDCVKALWRAALLVQNAKNSESARAIFTQCEGKVVAAYTKALTDKSYLDALRFYKSLEACKYEGIAALEKDESSLTALAQENVPGLGTVQNTVSEPAKVSSYIKGTVTVLVDKGIKVEKGMGFADAVLGSGFFISKDGYIVTNNHVIADCVDPKYEGFTRLYIKLAEDPDTRIPAKVIGYDAMLDLALLKAEVDAPYVFTLGSSSSLDVGDKVYAIGSPLGLERTLTSGIVSAVDRKLFTAGNVFQIDAAVNSGNSGGPLIDDQGRVQAIVFAGVQNYQGLNFAIPIEYLKYELPVLYNGGKREHAWIGSYGRTKKLPGSGTKNEGLTVQYVMPGGSASLAGLASGDVITSFCGKPISCLEDLQNTFMQLKAGMIASVAVTDQDGVESSHLVYLDKRPDEPGYEIYKHDVIALSFLPILGMELVPVSTESKRKYSVVTVLKGSIADDTGFSEHDPVDVLKVEFDEKKTAAYIELFTKKRKTGYMDLSIGLTAPMDSPYYF